MKIFVTKNQYVLICKALPLMVSFYRNNFEQLFQLIEDDYKLPKGSAQKANNIIQNIQITAPAQHKAENVEALRLKWNSPEMTDEQSYSYVIELSDNQRKQLSDVLDIFSRIVMGQLHILFEVMDIPDGLDTNQDKMRVYHDAYWDGGFGAKEARDILFPGIKNFGWHGGYGICAHDVSQNSKLAYQLSRALNNKYVLPVTTEPAISMR